MRRGVVECITPWVFLCDCASKNIGCLFCLLLCHNQFGVNGV